MNLYKKYLKLHFKSMIQYKLSFILSLIGQLLAFIAYYFVIVSLFDKFGNIKGFTVYEVLSTFSIIEFGFAFVECFGRGIDQFDNIIINGEFDRLLLRPKSILFQVLCSQVNFFKGIRMIEALIVMFIAIANLNVTLSIFKMIVLILMLLSSIVLFFGIFLLMASYCFITVSGLEVRNVLTDGGRHMAQYPIGVFKKGFLLFFTFIIPFALVNYYPLLYVIDKSNNIIYGLSPILVALFLIPALLSFKIGSKKYTSTGS